MKCIGGVLNWPLFIGGAVLGALTVIYWCFDPTAFQVVVANPISGLNGGVVLMKGNYSGTQISLILE